MSHDHNRVYRREPAWDKVEQGNEINNELRRIFPNKTMTIPQLNAEIRRLEPLEQELWLAYKAISKPHEAAWHAVVRQISELSDERAKLVDKITADTAQATV